jgi:hypothetical protein
MYPHVNVSKNSLSKTFKMGSHSPKNQILKKWTRIHFLSGTVGYTKFFRIGQECNEETLVNI